MSKAFFPIAALLALTAPAAAQQRAETPPDGYCPAAGDRELPRGPEWNCFTRANADYRFAFVYPKAVERIPTLDEIIRYQAGRAERWIAAQVQGGGNRPLSYEALWTLDVATPEIAAVSASISHYTGGAHGGIEYEAFLIDRRSGEPIELPNLFEPRVFQSRDAGDRTTGMWAVQDNFCRALTDEMRKRRGDPAAEIQCPAIEDHPVALICGPNGRIDRFRALLNPYVAGSWAEGPYEIEFPVDAVMMEEMKSRFRPAFGVPGEMRRRVPRRPCR